MNSRPSLLDRVHFDPAIEESAFVCLSSLDFAGCRRILSDLVEGLQLGLPVAESRQVVALLHDVLQKVNRRLHPRSGDQTGYLTHRMQLVEQFAGCLTADAARRQFVASLNAILAPMQSATPLHPLIQQAQAYIGTHYRRRLYLSAVAKALNVSPNYLSRLFRRETGVTLTAYIQRVRLDHARALLSDGAHRISEVAYLVGYQNYRDFYRNFVKYEKASPREMQRRLQSALRRSS